MQITFICSSCQTNLEVAASDMGQDIECPSCAAAITVPKQEPGPGTTLGGFYIKSLIGIGGMGNVFLATQLSMDRDIALKVLSAAVTRDPEDLERFMNEVRVTAKLEHPNIVSAYEAGEDDGYYYMAIAYVNGLALDKKIHQSENKRLKEKESLRIIKKIALALSYAWNDHGMLHRDVKPENILLDAHGEPKLADFGLSRTSQQAKRVTSHGTIMGTPNYMSPEQMNDLASADKRSDIYSLGATLYQMLTGKIPFDGSSVVKTFKLIATESLDDPRKYNPHISLHTIKLLEKMLARDADDRYQTWKDCLTDISLILNGKPILTPRLSAGKSVIKTTKPAQTNNQVAKRAATVQKSQEKNLVPVLATIAVLAILVFGVIKISDIHKQKQRRLQLIARENAKKIAAAEKKAILKERYADLIHYLNTNPDNYYGCIIKLKSALAADFKNTKYTDDIRKKLAAAMMAHDKDISLTWEALYNKSKKMFDAGQVEEAINMLRTYSGKYATELKDERYSRATTLEANYKKQIVDNTKVINNDAIIEKSLNALADALIAMDFDTVSDIIKKIDAISLSDEASVKWNTIKSHAEDAANSRNLVLLSFSNDIGKSVSISLKNGTTVSIRISRVSNDAIYGRSLIRTGGSYKNYTLSIDDINEFEYFKRLGPKRSTGLNIIRGILSASANLPDSAKKYFNNADCPLGRLIEKKLKETPVRNKPSPEELNAKKYYYNILKKLGVERTKYNQEQTIAAIKSKKYGELTRKNISTTLNTFNTQYKDTEFAASHIDVLDTIDSLCNNKLTKEFTPADINNVIKALLADNPRMKSLPVVTFQNNKLTIALDDPALTNIDALKDLPVNTISIKSCGIKSLRPLKNMPLESVIIYQCLNINDILPLKNAPLKSLVLDQCRVTDLSPLKGAPLKSLTVMNNPVFYDLSPLKDMHLTYLSVRNTKVSILKPLEKMPLTTLDIGFTKVNNIDPLRKLPLKKISLENTRIVNINILNNIPTLKTVIR